MGVAAIMATGMRLLFRHRGDPLRRHLPDGLQGTASPAAQGRSILHLDGLDGDRAAIR